MRNCKTRRYPQILPWRTAECNLSRPFPSRLALLELGQKLGARNAGALDPDRSTGGKTMGREISA
jgi:hypothetical protein